LKLDLSSKNSLEKKYLSLYDELYQTSLKSYNNLLFQLAKMFPNDIDWWVSNPVNRNTEENDLYRSYCYVILVKIILKNNKELKNIIVDSKGLYDVLNQIPGVENVELKLEKIGFLEIILKKIKPILVYSKIYINKLARLIIFKLFFKSKFKIPKTSIKLIDTYVHPGFYEKDRYFNGILNFLPNKEKSRIYFVPTIALTPVRKIRYAFKKLYESERQFLFKEYFLSFSDISYAMLHTFRKKSLKIKNLKHNNIDFSPLLNECLFDNSGLTHSVEGIINYKFIEKLKKSTIKIDLIIDWWENQAQDKGLNFGINKFYPNVITKGYLGYVPKKLDFHLFPTEYESKYKIIPNQIALIGGGFIETVKKFDKGLNVVSVPAYRFQHIYNQRIVRDKESIFKILLGLPINLSDSKSIINKVIKIVKKITLKNYVIMVKPHPALKISKIKNEFKNNWPKNFQLANMSSALAIQDADLMISRSSSICLESLACGVPVLIINKKNTFDNSSIPIEIDQNLWRDCKVEDDIIRGIKTFYERRSTDLSYNLKIGKKIRSTYFKPYSKEESKSFLEIK
jgi:hypothetical protein